MAEGALLSDVEEHTEIQIEEDGVCRGNNLNGERVEVSVDSIASMNSGVLAEYYESPDEHFVAFLKERDKKEMESFIPTVVDDLIKGGRRIVRRWKLPSWFGVTYPQDKEMVVESLTKLIAEGIYRQSMAESACLC